MRTPEITVRALVLGRELRGENHMRLLLLTETEGYLDLMKRVPAKPVKRPAASSSVDVFDTAEISFTHGNRFLAGYRLLHRREAIGSNYRLLQCASDWVQFLCANLPHMHCDAELFALCERSLDGFTTGHAPDASLLKSLYLLARQQGYAVNEDWAGRLGQSDHALVADMLRKPLSEIDTAPDALRPHITALLRWLAAETDFTIPKRLLET